MTNRPEAVGVWHLFDRLLIFPKGLLGGVAAATFMWMMVVVYQNWYATRSIRKMGYEGPVAAAGGWLYLLQLPWVVVLLSVAFGLGFYAVVSWIARHP